MARLNEVTFNAGLVRDLRGLALLREALAEEGEHALVLATLGDLEGEARALLAQHRRAQAERVSRALQGEPKLRRVA